MSESPIATTWGVSGWPTHYVIDARGVIRYVSLQGDLFDQAIDRLIAEIPRSERIPDLAIDRDVRRDRLDRSVRSVDQADPGSGGRRPELAKRRRPPQGQPLAGGLCKILVDCIKEGP